MLWADFAAERYEESHAETARRLGLCSWHANTRLRQVVPAEYLVWLAFHKPPDGLTVEPIPLCAACTAAARADPYWRNHIHKIEPAF